MFSFEACMPWTTQKNPSQAASPTAQSSTPSLFNFKRADAFEPAAPTVTAARLSGTISDIKAEMKSAGVFTSLPAKLPDTTRDKLIAAEHDFKGVDIKNIEDYAPAASRAPTPNVPEESQALRDVLFGVQMLDFPLTDTDTFFVVQLLQRQDALSPNDLKFIFDAFGREHRGRESFASLAANFMNTPGLSEPLMFEMARAYVEIVNKRFGPMEMPGSLKTLCAKLSPSVRDQLADYAVQSKMVNPANMTVSLQRPAAKASAPAPIKAPAARAEDASSKAALSARPADGATARTRPAIRPLKPIRSAATAKSVPLSQFYPKPATAKTDIKR